MKCVKSVPAYFAERLYQSMKVNVLFYCIIFAVTDNRTDTERNKYHPLHSNIAPLTEDTTANNIKKNCTAAELFTALELKPLKDLPRFFKGKVHPNMNCPEEVSGASQQNSNASAS